MQTVEALGANLIHGGESMRVVIAVALLLLPQSIAAAEDLPVEKTKKNIRVLQGLPSSQLIPVMAFMSNSLGVTCAHCHTDRWEADEKPAKEAARRMIALQRDINSRHYEGKTVVTCNSCHHGELTTAAVPSVANAGWNRATPRRDEPSAVPGEEAAPNWIKSSSATMRVVRGTVERFNGRSAAVSAPFTLTLAGDDVKYDTTLSHPPEASRAFGAFLLKSPPAERVKGERWVFDPNGGALLRRMREVPTALGPLPAQIEYGDYRPEGGQSLPHRAVWSRADYRVTFTIESVETH